MSYNKTFSIKEEIIKRAQKDSNFLWARKKEQTPIPKVNPSKVVGGKKAWGLLVALHQAVSELRP